MSKNDESEYVKHTQKDYSHSFKLQVAQEVESKLLGIKTAKRKYRIQGDATVRTWLRKHGNLDWKNKSHLTLENLQNKNH